MTVEAHGLMTVTDTNPNIYGGIKLFYSGSVPKGIVTIEWASETRRVNVGNLLSGAEVLSSVDAADIMISGGQARISFSGKCENLKLADGIQSGGPTFNGSGHGSWSGAATAD